MYETCLHDIMKHVYTMMKEMLTHDLNIRLENVCNMFEGMLYYV